MGVFSRIREFIGERVSRIDDFLEERINRPVKEFVGDISERISSRFRHDEPSIEPESRAEQPDETSSEDDKEYGDTGKGTDLDVDVDAIADKLGGILWDYDKEYFGDIGENADGKTYIETDYEIVLIDGEIIEGSIRFYGKEEDLIHAILAKHGELQSSEVAYILPVGV